MKRSWFGQAFQRGQTVEKAPWNRLHDFEGLSPQNDDREEGCTGLSRAIILCHGTLHALSTLLEGTKDSPLVGGGVPPNWEVRSNLLIFRIFYEGDGQIGTPRGELVQTSILNFVTVRF